LKKGRDVSRKRALKKLRLDIQRDKADPKKLSKWLKVMECKKQIFALEDRMDKLTRSLKGNDSKTS